MTAGRSSLKIASLLGVVLLAAAAAGEEASFRPFQLPPSARVIESDCSAGGWLESGVIRLTYVQAEASFMSEMSRRGWKFVHATTLNEGMTAGTSRRRLLLWRRGRQELTMMLHRIDVGKTGFAWGMSNSEVKSR
jgi:hypothetical protein